MAAPTKTAAIVIQQNMESKQVAAVNNKAKPLLSSQKSGKSAGSLAQNDQMRPVDVTHGQKVPPPTPPMAVAALQQNTKNIGEKPLISSQESGKLGGSVVSRNEIMRPASYATAAAAENSVEGVCLSF